MGQDLEIRTRDPASSPTRVRSESGATRLLDEFGERPASLISAVTTQDRTTTGLRPHGTIPGRCASYNRTDVLSTRSFSPGPSDSGYDSASCRHPSSISSALSTYAGTVQECGSQSGRTTPDSCDGVGDWSLFHPESSRQYHERASFDSVHGMPVSDKVERRSSLVGPWFPRTNNESFMGDPPSEPRERVTASIFSNGEVPSMRPNPPSLSWLQKISGLARRNTWKRRPLHCPWCIESDPIRPAALEDHILDHLKHLRSIQHQCQHCKVNFVHEKDLEYHRRVASLFGSCGFKHKGHCSGHHPESQPGSERSCFEDRIRNWEQAQLHSLTSFCETMDYEILHRDLPYLCKSASQEDLAVDLTYGSIAPHTSTNTSNADVIGASSATAQEPSHSVLRSSKSSDDICFRWVRSPESSRASSPATICSTAGPSTMTDRSLSSDSLDSVPSPPSYSSWEAELPLVEPRHDQVPRWVDLSPVTRNSSAILDHVGYLMYSRLDVQFNWHQEQSEVGVQTLGALPLLPKLGHEFGMQPAGWNAYPSSTSSQACRTRSFPECSVALSLTEGRPGLSATPELAGLNHLRESAPRDVSLSQATSAAILDSIDGDQSFGATMDPSIGAPYLSEPSTGYLTALVGCASVVQPLQSGFAFSANAHANDDISMSDSVEALDSSIPVSCHNGDALSTSIDPDLPPAKKRRTYATVPITEDRSPPTVTTEISHPTTGTLSCLPKNPGEPSAQHNLSELRGEGSDDSEVMEPTQKKIWSSPAGPAVVELPKTPNKVAQWFLDQQAQSVDAEAVERRAESPASAPDLASVWTGRSSTSAKRPIFDQIHDYFNRTEQVFSTEYEDEMDDNDPTSALFENVYSRLALKQPVTLNCLPALAHRAAKSNGVDVHESEIRLWTRDLSLELNTVLEGPGFKEVVQFIYNKLHDSVDDNYDLTDFVASMSPCYNLFSSDSTESSRSNEASTVLTYNSCVRQRTASDGPPTSQATPANGYVDVSTSRGGNKRRFPEEDGNEGPSKRTFLQVGHDVDPSKSVSEGLQLPCIVDGCIGRDAYIANLLRKLESHAVFLCGKCYQTFDTSLDKTRHTQQLRCEQHCVLPECPRNHRSGISSEAVLSLRHKAEPDCPTEKHNAAHRWRYLYALKYTDASRVPQPRMEVGLVTPHNLRNPAIGRSSRPTLHSLTSELAQCRRLLREAQLENVMLKQQVDQTHLVKETNNQTEAAKNEATRMESSAKIKTLAGLLRLCREQIHSQELRDQIDDECPAPSSRRVARRVASLPASAAYVDTPRFPGPAMDFSGNEHPLLQRYDSAQQNPGMNAVLETRQMDPAQDATIMMNYEMGEIHDEFMGAEQADVADEDMSFLDTDSGNGTWSKRS